MNERERILEEYGGSYDDFMRNESDRETEMERIIRVSEGERTCCADPNCSVWSDEWLEES